ncbi:MFS transporter [Halocatena marina]|uniref:MFS transporter n=2 Tax=Halocatena marina TaxID=2934937 RepID=A0ABD5YTL3_9EURY|nr:MFS transporter [Halocatena marina]
MCSMVFLVNLARVVFSPLLEPLKISFGVTDATIGLLATLVWLGSALPRIPVGYALTKVPRHHVVLVSGGILTVSAAFSAVAQNIEVLMGGAFALGVSSGAYFIAANPLVSELFPERVGKALGTHGMSSQLAAVSAAPVVGAVLFLGSWRLAFGVLASVGALATVIFFVIAYRTELPAAGAGDRDFVNAAREQWRIILVGVTIIGITGFVWNGVFNFYITYMITSKSVSQPAAQGLLTVLFAAGVPAFFVTGNLADRIPNIPLVFVICGLFVCCLLALTATTGYLSLLIISAVLGYVIHGMFPAIDTFLLSSFPDENRASAYAIYSGSMMIVQASGSSVLGYLISTGHPFNDVFYAFSGLIVAVLAVFVFVYLTGRFPIE